MILAGNLLYKLEFYKNLITQSETGAESYSTIKILSCRAEKIKNSGSFTINAKELFHENTLIFKVRNNKLIDENLIVLFENKKYRIAFFDRKAYENSIELTLEKINE